MKKSRFLLLITGLLAVVILAGCAMGPRAESVPGVSADGSTIYVAYKQHIYKLNGGDGVQVWRYPEKPSAQIVMYAAPVIEGDSIYFGDLTNKFKELDANTAQPKWEYTGAKGWFQAKAAIADGTIVAPNSDRNVYGLNMDGTLKWTYKNEFAFVAEPVINGDKVFISALDKKVVALDLNTGEELWSAAMNGSVPSAPIYSEENGLLYVGSIAQEFVALDPESGERAWAFDDGGALSSVWSSPIAHNGSVVFTAEDGKVYSLDGKTGALNWKLDAGGKTMAGPLELDNAFVIALEDGTVKAYDFDQKPLWTRNISGEVYTTPVLSEDKIIIAAIKGDNLVYALDQSGNQLWAFKPGK